MGFTNSDNAISKVPDLPYYNKLLNDAFGPTTTLTLQDQVATALVAFVMSITTSSTKYDQYHAGHEQLTDIEERGMNLFKSNTTAIAVTRLKLSGNSVQSLPISDSVIIRIRVWHA